MDDVRLAPLVGIAGCVLVFAGLAVPYGLVETGAGRAVGAYYGTGAVNPFVAGLFSLVAVIVFAAGREGRTEPDLAAGVSLALGFFVLIIAVLWAVTVPEDVVAGMGENTLIDSHRWALAAVSALVPVASAWWSRALGLL